MTHYYHHKRQKSATVNKNKHVYEHALFSRSFPQKNNQQEECVNYNNILSRHYKVRVDTQIKGHWDWILKLSNYSPEFYNFNKV